MIKRFQRFAYTETMVIDNQICLYFYNDFKKNAKEVFREVTGNEVDIIIKEKGLSSMAFHGCCLCIEVDAENGTISRMTLAITLMDGDFLSDHEHYAFSQPIEKVQAFLNQKVKRELGNAFITMLSDATQRTKRNRVHLLIASDDDGIDWTAYPDREAAQKAMQKAYDEVSKSFTYDKEWAEMSYCGDTESVFYRNGDGVDRWTIIPIGEMVYGGEN